MLWIFSAILIITLSLTWQPRVAGAAALPVSEPQFPTVPFWQTKPELYRCILEDRAVIMAVKKEDLPQELIRFTVRGAGVVNVPHANAFALAQEYTRLTQVSDHFRTVTYEPSSQKLFLHTQALGYQARMLMQVHTLQTPQRSELQLVVKEGSFQGMRANIGFARLEPTRTEVSLDCVYESKVLPLPKALMGFALEVIAQKVAEKMRSHLEEQYRKSLAQKPKAL